MLISDEYKALLQKTHATSPGWGTTATKHHLDKLLIATEGIKTILDYGCGKGALKPFLEADGHVVDEYDPGIPGKDSIPRGHYDLVVCIDVLEHLEPDTVEANLLEMSILGDELFLIVDTVPAKKVLPDGRNAHLTVRDKDFWLGRFKVYKKIMMSGFDGRRLWAICGT